jgi:hypothetical protein
LDSLDIVSCNFWLPWFLCKAAENDTTPPESPRHHSTKVLVALQAMHPGTPRIGVAATKITPDMQVFGEYELF